MIFSEYSFEPALRAKIEQATGEELRLLRGDTPPELLAQAEILLSLGGFDAEALRRFPNLRWLFTMSAGVEKLPFGALQEAGVTVTNASGIHTSQMSEYTLGAMLAYCHRLFEMRENQRNRFWNRHLEFSVLRGKELLIVGAGSIGREIARKAKAFDMRVTGLKRHPETLPFFDAVYGMERFHEMLPRADFVVLVTPLTPETWHLMGAAEFALMKPDSLFVNISRGAAAAEDALAQALQNGRPGAAALDVFETEPLPPESPLWSLPNVFVTPHISGLAPDYFEQCTELFLRSYRCWRSSEPMPNLVDPVAQY